VAFNKMDLPEVRERWPQVRRALAARGAEALAISAATGEGVHELLKRAVERLDEQPATLPLASADAERIYRPTPAEMEFTIEREGERWRVRGQRIERVTAMTNWSYYEAAQRFQRILEAMGISAALEEAGVREGDTVVIGDTELIWGEQEE